MAATTSMKPTAVNSERWGAPCCEANGNWAILP
eukprot:CAMPEP_0178442188 /NCGR_PEP_ID=MMETSP0689_2-20121128/38002_1 /TAXON_ID=160604 /ORGANISM="Amphidinium massartii, Strain CS-259" /LENGTH=32 /DNA_ID= /DNA_START= /DNA_END= /DNA_ORIENTATION=